MVSPAFNREAMAPPRIAGHAYKNGRRSLGGSLPAVPRPWPRRVRAQPGSLATVEQFVGGKHVATMASADSGKMPVRIPAKVCFHLCSKTVITKMTTNSIRRKAVDCWTDPTRFSCSPLARLSANVQVFVHEHVSCPPLTFHVSYVLSLKTRTSKAAAGRVGEA